MAARLHEQYNATIRPALIEQFKYRNAMQAPRLDKIVINMGVGDATQDSKKIGAAVSELTKITGQRAVSTKARRSIAAFKLREGMPIGCKVTLRGQRMFEFLDRLMNLALPRVRDFRGVSPKGFDGRGNYTLGIREHLVFPEVNMSKVQKVKGLNVCIVTSAKTDEEARLMLSEMGMPFQKPETR